jgi:hypothetical protein
MAPDCGLSWPAGKKRPTFVANHGAICTSQNTTKRAASHITHHEGLFRASEIADANKQLLDALVAVSAALLLALPPYPLD